MYSDEYYLDEHDRLQYQAHHESQKESQRVLEIQTLIRYHKTLVECLETELKVMELGIGKRKFSDVIRSKPNTDIPF
jgi:hypothetical protein